jgi:hypothetical protein
VAAVHVHRQYGLVHCIQISKYCSLYLVNAFLSSNFELHTILTYLKYVIFELHGENQSTVTIIPNYLFTFLQEQSRTSATTAINVFQH